MNEQRLALILATQAEIEGMKIENTVKQAQGYFPTYDEASFNVMAEKLRYYASLNDDQIENTLKTGG